VAADSLVGQITKKDIFFARHLDKGENYINTSFLRFTAQREMNE